MSSEVDRIHIAGNMHVTTRKLDEENRILEAEIKGHGLFRRKEQLAEHEHLVRLHEGPLHVSIVFPDLHYTPGVVYLNRDKYLSEKAYALPPSSLIEKRAGIRERYGADCPAGHDAGVRQIRELTELGERTWYECIECGITVKPPCCGEDHGGGS